MEYVESKVYQGSDSHTDVIRCLSFNVSGTLIASGGDDHSIKIWDTKGTNLKIHVEGHSSVLSLAWTTDPHILIAGFEDGVVVTIIITEELLETHSMCLRETQRRPVCPIETLSLNTRTRGAKTSKIRLATGGHQRVHVWNQRERLSYQWSGDHELPDPFVNGVNNAKEILVTGLEWLDESLLLVSYMYHGLIIWDSINKTTTNSIPVPSPIGRMAVSPDCLNVAVSNFRDGVDIWDRLRHGLKKSCRVSRMGRKFPLPVIFLHGGYAVASGSMEGQVTFWDVKTGMLIDELPHPGQSVHALSSFFSYDRIKKEDKFVIATAASAHNQHQIHIWEAFSNSAILSTRRNHKLRKSVGWRVRGGCVNCLMDMLEQAYTLSAVIVIILAVILGTHDR